LDLCLLDTWVWGLEIRQLILYNTTFENILGVWGLLKF
jgi:hypothetical protein